MDLKRFFDAVRVIHGHVLTVDQVGGINAILDGWNAAGWKDPRWVAYMLATTHHETAKRMTAVRETLAGSDDEAVKILERAWAAGKLPWVKVPYWREDPITGLHYFGRGLVQLTHKENYAKAGAKLGVELVYQPQLALRSDIAVQILIKGMVQGWFAGDSKGRHTLDRYFREGVDDPIGARRIINGQDKAREIAALHGKFLAAIKGNE